MLCWLYQFHFPLVIADSRRNPTDSKIYVHVRNLPETLTYNSLTQIFLKLIGSLGSPCDCNLIGEAPCAL